TAVLPRLPSEYHVAVLISASDRTQIALGFFRLRNFLLGGDTVVAIYRAQEDIVLTTPVCAESNPAGAILIHRDGATPQILFGTGYGNRLAPFAAAVILDEELVAELRRVICLEVLRLLFQHRRLDAAALFLDRVTDVGDPECAVRAVTGGGEVVFGLGGDDRRSGRDQKNHSRALPKSLWVAGGHGLPRNGGFFPFCIFRPKRERRVFFHLRQVQDNADRGDGFHSEDRRLARRDAQAAMRVSFPCVRVDKLVAFLGAETIAFAVRDARARNGRPAGPVFGLRLLQPHLDQNGDRECFIRRLGRPFEHEQLWFFATSRGRHP